MTVCYKAYYTSLQQFHKFQETPSMSPSESTRNVTLPIQAAHEATSNLLKYVHHAKQNIFNNVIVFQHQQSQSSVFQEACQQNNLIRRVSELNRGSQNAYQRLSFLGGNKARLCETMQQCHHECLDFVWSSVSLLELVTANSSQKKPTHNCEKCF